MHKLGHVVAVQEPNGVSFVLAGTRKTTKLANEALITNPVEVARCYEDIKGNNSQKWVKILPIILGEKLSDTAVEELLRNALIRSKGLSHSDLLLLGATK